MVGSFFFLGDYRESNILSCRQHGTPLKIISKNYFWVVDGARTHDRRYHKPELYQLSYNHH